MNVNSIAINLSEMAAGTYLLWQAPTDALGGGVSIVGGAISGAGTCIITLNTGSNVGTPAINGTIGSMGGTLSAGVPAALTVDDGWVDGGEWVMGVLSANAVDGMICHVNYVMGK
jgi:hypothetical protein